MIIQQKQFFFDRLNRKKNLQSICATSCRCEMQSLSLLFYGQAGRHPWRNRKSENNQILIFLPQIKTEKKDRQSGLFFLYIYYPLPSNRNCKVKKSQCNPHSRQEYVSSLRGNLHYISYSVQSCSINPFLF